MVKPRNERGSTYVHNKLESVSLDFPTALCCDYCDYMSSNCNK